jgi:hypothetical protein
MCTEQANSYTFSVNNRNYRVNPDRLHHSLSLLDVGIKPVVYRSASLKFEDIRVNDFVKIFHKNRKDCGEWWYIGKVESVDKNRICLRISATGNNAFNYSVEFPKNDISEGVYCVYYLNKQGDWAKKKVRCADPDFDDSSIVILHNEVPYFVQDLEKAISFKLIEEEKPALRPLDNRDFQKGDLLRAKMNHETDWTIYLCTDDTQSTREFQNVSSPVAYRTDWISFEQYEKFDPTLKNWINLVEDKKS